MLCAAIERIMQGERLFCCQTTAWESRIADATGLMPGIIACRAQQSEGFTSLHWPLPGFARSGCPISNLVFPAIVYLLLSLACLACLTFPACIVLPTYMLDFPASFVCRCFAVSFSPHPLHAVFPRLYWCALFTCRSCLAYWCALFPCIVLPSRITGYCSACIGGSLFACILRRFCGLGVLCPPVQYNGLGRDREELWVLLFVGAFACLFFVEFSGFSVVCPPVGHIVLPFWSGLPSYPHNYFHFVEK